MLSRVTGAVNGSSWAGTAMGGQATQQSVVLGEAMANMQNKKMLDTMKLQLDMAVMTMVRALCESLSKVVKSAGESVKNLT